jgi:hypothetical protein
MKDMDTKHHIENIPISDIPKTPSRRKAQSQTPRKARLTSQENIPWTAARCNRLLRTIASRIHILRRLSENDFAEHALRTPKAKRKREGTVDPVEKLGSKLAALQTPGRGDDPEWFPTTVKKNVAKTYGGKGKAGKGKAETVSDNSKSGVGFNTPYIKKILRSEAAVSPADDAYSTSTRINQVMGTTRQDSIQPTTHSERALKTLLDSFGTLLAQTDPKTHVPRRGVSSLASMCMRRVPVYIDFEQNWAEEKEGDYAYDATEAVYNLLQDIGTGGSWPGLREVVRSHAVRMIADAMIDRMWPLKSLDLLMAICAKHHATIEAQHLLRAWLVSSKGKIDGGLSKFVSWCIDLDFQGFMLRTLRDLLSRGELEHLDLVQEDLLWMEVPTCFFRKSCQQAIIDFVQLFATTSSRQPAEIDQRSKASMEIIRASMTIITMKIIATELDQNDNEELRESAADQVHRMAAMALENLPSDSKFDTGATSQVLDPILASSLMLYALMSTAGSVEQDRSISALVATIATNENQAIRQSGSKRHNTTHNVRSRHICSVAKHLELVNKVPASSIMSRTLYGLLRLAGTYDDANTTTFLANLTIDAASVWADEWSDNMSYALVDEISKQALEITRSADDDSIRRGMSVRWEEGIGEWVTATPHPEASHQQDTESCSISSPDSGIGMSESKTPSKEEEEPQFLPMLTSVNKAAERREVSPGLRETQETIAELGTLPSGSPSPPLSEEVCDEFEPALSPCLPRARTKKQRKPSRQLCAPKQKLFEERDELSISPSKPPSPQTLSLPTSPPTKACQELVDRDELSNTPCAARTPQTPVPKRATLEPRRRGKTRQVDATPARMTLRSRRNVVTVSRTLHGEGLSEDELGV